MNLQEIKLLDDTTEYDVVLRQIVSDSKSSKSDGWVLELILCADRRVFEATTARGNIRIFKTLETALTYALDACKNRKSMSLIYRTQKFSITTIENEV